jgi:hypothetical protein
MISRHCISKSGAGLEESGLHGFNSSISRHSKQFSPLHEGSYQNLYPNLKPMVRGRLTVIALMNSLPFS